ncbi:hypothetical protein Tco_1058949 [Tanacetum coccineum]
MEVRSPSFFLGSFLLGAFKSRNPSDKVYKRFGDGAARVGMQLRSSPKVSTSPLLVSPSTIINVLRELYSIDVAVTFGSLDINKSTSYAGVAGASAKDQPKVNSNFRPLVADPVFDGVNISIPRKVVEKTTGNSSKKDNLSMSNSFSALNEEEEEDVKNVYDESANLIQNTKADGSSSFTAVACSSCN